jgi:hypothetical protein
MPNALRSTRRGGAIEDTVAVRAYGPSAAHRRAADGEAGCAMLDFVRCDDYPAALARLWAVFGDPSYPLAKYRALGATSVRLERFDVSPASIAVDLERVVPVDRASLPAWCRPLVGATQTLRHRSEWRRVAPATVDASLEIAPRGLPVRAEGRGTITELDGAHSRMEVRWQVTSPLPALGGRVEQLFADQLRAALAADHDFTAGYLERHRR